MERILGYACFKENRAPQYEVQGLHMYNERLQQRVQCTLYKHTTSTTTDICTNHESDQLMYNMYFPSPIPPSKDSLKSEGATFGVPSDYFTGI